MVIVVSDQRIYFAAPCSGSNLSAIHHRAMTLQSQCQDYLRKAEYALQTVSHNLFFFCFPPFFTGSEKILLVFQSNSCIAGN